MKRQQIKCQRCSAGYQVMGCLMKREPKAFADLLGLNFEAGTYNVEASDGSPFRFRTDYVIRAESIKNALHECSVQVKHDVRAMRCWVMMNDGSERPAFILRCYKDEVPHHHGDKVAEIASDFMLSMEFGGSVGSPLTIIIETE